MDPEVLEPFPKEAKRRKVGYQTLINQVLSFDLKNGGCDVITSSVLRVWKKEEGQWKIAALFARPHDVEAGAAPAKREPAADAGPERKDVPPRSSVPVLDEGAA